MTFAIRRVEIGETLHIHVGSETFASLEAKIKKALNAGRSIKESGREIWIDESVIFDKTKTGSAAYIWRGDKVKVQRVLVSKDAHGKLSRENIGFAWRAL